MQLFAWQIREGLTITYGERKIVVLRLKSPHLWSVIRTPAGKEKPKCKMSESQIIGLVKSVRPENVIWGKVTPHSRRRSMKRDPEKKNAYQRPAKQMWHQQAQTSRQNSART